MRGCPHNVRIELEEFFEQILESPDQAILYEIDSNRVDYLYRWGRFLKDEAALESVSFSQDHPRYGKGMWQEIRLVPSEKGLVGFVSNATELTNAQIIINAAFLKKEVVVTAKTVLDARKTYNILCTKLTKMRKRYKDESYGEDLREVVIDIEETRVVVRRSGTVKSRLKPISLNEAKNVKFNGNFGEIED